MRKYLISSRRRMRFGTHWLVDTAHIVRIAHISCIALLALISQTLVSHISHIAYIAHVAHCTIRIARCWGRSEAPRRPWRMPKCSRCLNPPDNLHSCLPNAPTPHSPAPLSNCPGNVGGHQHQREEVPPRRVRHAPGEQVVDFPLLHVANCAPLASARE